MPLTPSVEQLVAAARSGDREAQRALYERTVGWVERLSFRLMRSRAEAEDVMQESYLQAFLSLAQLREASRFEGWLRSVVVGTAHKRSRRIRLWGRGLREGLELEHLESKDASPEVRAELSRVLTAIGSLPGELRIPYVLRYVEGMTVPEIAASIDWSQRTVKRRIQAATERLEKRGVRHGAR